MLRFDSGIVAQVSTAVRASLDNTLDIFGSDGCINVPNPWLADRQNPIPGAIRVTAGGVTERIDLPADRTSFAYEAEHGAKPVIDDINLNINAPGLHAIVGPNGSGKTTLLKLMQGLYDPDSGRVLLDGADVGQFSRAQTARWIGYVPQELFLFAGSVRENIAKADPEATDEAVVAAARLAGVHEHIVDLPDGYATEIGEAGRRLSGGLRQRLAIARALMGEPAALLLDEPSASLDREAEEALRDTLVALALKHNVIVVSHSPILLPACDNVLALDQGRIALAGPAKEILPRLFQGKRPATLAEAEAKQQA